jgi:pyrrolidone-carboxylate peptidase
MIILTGFEKFGEYPLNISEEIVRNFPENFEGFLFTKKVLPVSWKSSIKDYERILFRLKSDPRLTLLTGIYSGKKILIERCGWNLAFGLDNKNKFRIGIVKIKKYMRLKSVLNLENIISNMKNTKNVSFSSYPGLFLCNYIYFWALYLAKGNYPVIFIHLPTKGNINSIEKKFYNIVEIILASI